MNENENLDDQNIENESENTQEDEGENGEM